MNSSSALAPSLAALFLAGLLWGVGYLHVPPALGTGLLIVAGLALAGYCLTLRRLLPLLAGLLCVAAIGGFAVDLLVLERDVLRVASRAEFGDDPPTSLRVVSFNVLHGYPHFPDQEARAERTIAALRALEPDIVILQEAWRTRRHGDFVERLGAALGMDSAFARANGNLQRIGFEEGEAVLSRYPIVQAIRMQLEPRKPFFERRVALVCVLDLGGGEPLLVAGTHLHHRNLETAAAQSRHLAARLANLPLTLVAGDFNAPSGGPTLEAFEAIDFVDLLPGGIDHLLLRRGGPWRVAAVDWALRPARDEGETEALSDHPAILLELTRTGEGR